MSTPEPTFEQMFLTERDPYETLAVDLRQQFDLVAGYKIVGDEVVFARFVDGVEKVYARFDVVRPRVDSAGVQKALGLRAFEARAPMSMATTVYTRGQLTALLQHLWANYGQ